MKEANRLLTTLFVALLAASSLPGCAAGPILVDGRLQFPEYKFSVDTPPREWVTIEPKPLGAVIAWRNSVTKSLIGVTASRVKPGVSLQKEIEVFKATITKGIPDSIAKRFPGAENFQGKITVAIEEEKETTFAGKTFQTIILDYGGIPAEGVSLSGGIIFYVLKTDAFVYTLSLNAVRGYYDKDLPVVEQVAQSFAVLK